MAWTWRFQDADGGVAAEGPSSPSFPAQGDAESWLGEAWRELAAAGVVSVTLLDGNREVYGPMSLEPLDQG